MVRHILGMVLAAGSLSLSAFYPVAAVAESLQPTVANEAWLRLSVGLQTKKEKHFRASIFW
ncbi:hypothetical protein [Phocaeicola sp. HCN-6420]|uniref:hypothetical protein n=1 Tax=Phocaeicola sp. HCN-6420 TaxID=3134673 RepID=UPI0030C49D3A